MKMENKAMLITYPNRMGTNLAELRQLMTGPFAKAFGGVHILPFYYSSGDAGFAPYQYEVDPQFGSWADVEQLAKTHYLMFDFMVNHLSPKSPEFQDFVAHHRDSKFADLFLSWDQFWPAGRPTKEDVDLIYKRKDKAPFMPVQFADGTTEKIWNTFGDQQMDLDVRTETTMRFIEQNLTHLTQHGASIIRLDAFAYAVKKLGTSDFFVEPETWHLLDRIKEMLAGTDVTLLPEIHENYTYNEKMHAHGYFSYDFVLPIITLHALYSHKVKTMVDWFNQADMHQFTTLDTHDGIGVVDGKDILTDEELDYTVDQLYKVGANVKRAYSSAKYHNLDIYQLNTTYYSATGNNDAAYLCARALQMFAPGIPQVYYVGLLAGKNDTTLVEQTREGRDINRHFYTLDEVHAELQRPVVQKVLQLLEFRNSCPAFDLEGTIKAEALDNHTMRVTRTDREQTFRAVLTVDLAQMHYTIEVKG